MSQVETVLQELGMELPPAPKPLASYVPAIRCGNLVFTSGQLPMMQGKLWAEGIVGRDVTLETAAQCAQVCALNALAAVKLVLPSLDHIGRIVKVTVFVASDPSFTDQPKVANGASEFFQQVFGERGRHARSAVACPSLPINAPVELELTVEVAS